ncbi:MAG: transporter substrate-binding domain-containing protein, partial [Deltaproteobacteria bacterium]|nr:transporter substrate-binding domain-containing protein [Deltaproteobacteria bacterium]
MKTKITSVRSVLGVVLSTLLFLNVCGQVHAIQLEILTCEEPPMNFKKGEEVTGIITDVVKEIIKRTGIKGTIQLEPWARVYKKGLNEPNVVLFTAARTEQRENLFKWVGPMINKRWGLFAKRESSIKIKSLDDAKKVGKIGVMRGDARETLLRAKGFKNLYLLNNHIQALKMLMIGRIDLFASADIEISSLTREAGIHPSDEKVVWTLKEIQSYILISKKTSGATVRILQEAFEEIK